jgi:hypothetical protein
MIKSRKSNKNKVKDVNVIWPKKGKTLKEQHKKHESGQK